MFNSKVILITGGTGSFGHKFAELLIKEYDPQKIIIYSRDEFKQDEMRKTLSGELSSKNFSKLRFFIGDVRDKERLRRAFYGVDFVIHAAAMKQVPACEYNPFEAVKTNVYGAQNIIDCAIDCGVKKVVALSTDKAVSPVNLYGGTKLVSDKLFISGNAYTGGKGTVFSVVRYGNVAGSRGSVIPFFLQLYKDGKKDLPVTDFRMTRFWITLEEGVRLVFKAFNESKGGETYISRIPSFKIEDLARAISPDGVPYEVGIREGEKLNEVMISKEDSPYCLKYDDHYIIYPQLSWWRQDFEKAGGERVPEGFEYNSGNNDEWLSTERIREKLEILGYKK